MTTLDTILVASTLAMYAVLLICGFIMYKKGVSLMEIVMHICAVLTVSNGKLGRHTLWMNAFVIVFTVIFALIFTVPTYTTLWMYTWVVAWCMQLSLHFISKAPLQNTHLFGVKVIMLFNGK